MPLYDYRCHKCGETFEVIQKFSDEPLTTHEGCGGEVERLLSPSVLKFKGSGWYVTDYAKRGKPPSTGGGTATDKGKSDAKPKADSKPAEKSSS